MNLTGAIMNIARQLGSAKIDRFAGDAEGNIRELRDSTAPQQSENNHGEMSANDLAMLLGRVSGTSTREIDNLIGELQTLRKKLQTDSNRLQRDIADYASLSQSVMQLTKIVSDSVKKLPDAPDVT
jgi:hypothetical protein